MDRSAKVLKTASAKQSALLDRPWRKFEKDPWTEEVYESLKGEIATYELPEKANLRFCNVLLIGQISAGKSSFYNTVESVFANHVTRRADAGTLDKSLTTKFRSYPVKAVDNDRKPIRFRFCDTMGLSTESGLSPNDYGIIMDGQVQDGADLREDLDTGFQSYMEDKMHCVVFLVAAPTMEFMDEGVIEKMAKIREQGTKRNLNPVVILTRIDECCAELHRDEGDITKVFHSERVRDLVVEASQRFGVSEGMVCPVQNYSTHWEKEMRIDILLLRALRQILWCSQTCIKDMIEREQGKQKQDERREAAMKEQREGGVEAGD